MACSTAKCWIGSSAFIGTSDWYYNQTTGEVRASLAAAQVAMVDHLVEGRFVLGVGPGVGPDAEAIGELHLIERLAKQALLVALAPRPRQLVLVEDSELHVDSLRGR